VRLSNTLAIASNNGTPSGFASCKS
jgi:hypothetical protein